MFAHAPVNISNADMNFLSDIENDKTSSQICTNNIMCCDNRIFEVLNMGLNPVLHTLSGLQGVHEDVIKLNINFKSLYVELIDTLIYHIYLALIQSNPTQDTVKLIEKFYQLFHTELRRKLSNVTRELDLKSIVSAIFDNKACFDNIDFISKFNEATDKSFLSLYGHARNLESIIQKINDFSLSEDCKKELLKMTLCGICSQSLDWTSYKIKKTNVNIKICPKYCHTTIRKCMSYYLLLAKQLQVFQEAFLTYINQHIFNMDEYSSLWIHKDYKRMTIFQMINTSKNDINKKMKKCSLPPPPYEYQDLEDDQDMKATSKFLNCINNNKCVYIQNRRTLKIYFTKNFANSIADLRRILNTWLNPKHFTKNLIGQNCDNSDYSRCWNGLEIGQYHNQIIEFDMHRNEIELSKSVSSSQLYDIKEVVTFIQQSRSELNWDKFELRNNIPIIEGSGVTHPFSTDDEDYGRNVLRNGQSDVLSKYTVTSKQTKQAHRKVVSEGGTLSVFGNASQLKNTLQVSLKNTCWIMKISDVILVILSGVSIANYQIL